MSIEFRVPAHARRCPQTLKVAAENAALNRLT